MGEENMRGRFDEQPTDRCMNEGAERRRKFARERFAHQFLARHEDQTFVVADANAFLKGKSF